MDFRLSEEEEMVVASARKFGAKWGPRMHEVARKQLEEGQLEKAFFEEFAEVGFAGALIPEEYGGSGMGLTPLALAIEAMGIEGAGSALVMLTQMNALCILRAGPEEARKKYLPKVADGSLTMAFAITEPDAGSNSFEMRSVAERRGEDIVLNGTKTFITGVDLADKLLVIARSMPYEVVKEKGLPKTAGFNVVIVDKDAEGFSMTEVPTRGIEGMKQWTLHFDDVVVDDLIARSTRASCRCGTCSNAERTLAAATAIGMAERLLEKGGRLREGAQRLRRQADRRLPGHPAPARRDQGGARGRAPDALQVRDALRSERPPPGDRPALDDVQVPRRRARHQAADRSLQTPRRGTASARSTG